MGFPLPRTRLAFKHLMPLSCQRLGTPTTLTTWVSTLYVILTNSLELQDAILLESLLSYILRHHHETLLRVSWNYVHYLRHHHELPSRGSWNYVHYLRHHHELSSRGHGITSIIWGTTMNSHHEVHGITSIIWGITMNSHHEVHGITSII